MNENRVWAYYEPISNEKGVTSSREVTMTEKQIIEKYYDDWCERVEKAGKKDMISMDNCIQDWVAVNWAYPKA